jgi:hypothetical protein
MYMNICLKRGEDSLKIQFFWPKQAVAAATAVLGFDLFRDEPWTVSDMDRVITGLGVTGSAAAGDAAVDLLVGQVRVVRKYNQTTGFPNMDNVQPLDAAVPAGSKVSAPVVDAPATSPLNVVIIIEEL